MNADLAVAALDPPLVTFNLDGIEHYRCTCPSCECPEILRVEDIFPAGETECFDCRAGKHYRDQECY